MDRRKFSRVALIVGLLFCVLLLGVWQLWQTGKAVQKEEQKEIGILVKKYPKLEAEIVKGLSEEAGKEEERLGKELEEKYGYNLTDNTLYKIYETYARRIAFLLIVGFGICLSAILLSMRMARKSQEERERAEERLQEIGSYAERTKEHLNKEEQKTKKLITDISHQLKTPIAALKMSYEIADSTVLSREEQQEFVRKEREDVHKMEVLLDSFMQLAKLETKMIQLSPKANSLKELLTKAVGSIYMKAYQKKINICMEEFEDCTVQSDARWTEEAFVNILDNAIKYSLQHTEIKIRATELVNYMLVEIEDEGPGISPDEAALIFQRFYRGRNSAGIEGSGVGLYLARKIMEEQGGTICVKQGKSSGSCFVMTIPKRA